MDEIKQNNSESQNTTNAMNLTTETKEKMNDISNKIINKTENAIDKIDDFLEDDFFDDDSYTLDSSSDSTYSKEEHNISISWSNNIYVEI